MALINVTTLLLFLMNWIPSHWSHWTKIQNVKRHAVHTSDLLCWMCHVTTAIWLSSRSIFSLIASDFRTFVTPISLMIQQCLYGAILPHIHSILWSQKKLLQLILIDFFLFLLIWFNTIRSTCQFFLCIEKLNWRLQMTFLPGIYTTILLATTISQTYIAQQLTAGSENNLFLMMSMKWYNW